MRDLFPFAEYGTLDGSIMQDYMLDSKIQRPVFVDVFPSSSTPDSRLVPIETVRLGVAYMLTEHHSTKNTLDTATTLPNIDFISHFRQVIRLTHFFLDDCLMMVDLLPIYELPS